MKEDITLQKVAESELQSAFATLQLLVNSVPASIAYVDHEERYQLVNRSLEEYLGVPVDRIVGQRVSDVQPPAVYAEMEPHIRKALAGEQVRYQANPIGPDGKSRWFDVQYVPRRGSDGRVSGFFVLRFEITESKRSEIALAESRSRLDSILNSMEDVVWSATPDGRVLNFLSASAESLYGQPLAAFYADPAKWMEMIHPQDQEAVQRAFHKVPETGELDVEYRILRNDGTVRWVLDRGWIVKDDRGHPLRRDGIVTDITERKMAGEALRESEEKFSKAFRNSPDAVVITTLDGEILEANAGFTRLTGYSLEESRGRTTTELHFWADAADRERFISTLREHGRVMELEAALRTRTGDLRTCLISAELMDLGGKPAIVGVVRDITERRIAQEALRRSEEQLRSLAENLPDVVARLDQNRRHLYVNPAVESATGLKPEALIGRTSEELGMPVENTAVWRAVLDRVFASGGDERLEFSYPGPSGKKFWESHAVAERGADGEVESALVISRDITERKRLEQEREQYLKFFRLSTEPMCIADPCGCFMQVNPAFIRLIGFSESELVAKSFLDFVLPEDREETAEKMQRQVASRPSSQFENRYVCKDGTALLLSWTAIFDQNDGVTYATARDITKIRQGELALRDSETRYRTLFEANPHPMWAYDLETLRFLAVNASAMTHYGYSREEFLAMTIKEIRPPEDIPALMVNVAAVGDGLDEAGVWRHRKRDGAIIEVEITSHVTEFDGRRAEVVLAHDVTEQRRAKLEREQLDRKMQATQKLESLGVLAGGIAHDFNNILTAILGNASLAINDVSPDSPVHECLDQIHQAALRAADLCKQMLAYSGRGRFVVRRLDLGQLISETIQMLQISISKKAMLHFRPTTGLPPVEVDPTQMRQVIMNLVINASDAIGEKVGIITVATGLAQVDRDYLVTAKMPSELPVGDYVFVEVSDDGCGMSAETLAKIFDPFFTTKFTGRGLGLAAVLGIVRGHKGAMKVSSELGRGTTFKLLFPAATGPTEAAPESPAAATGWRGHGTVLVVEDEQAVRATVAPMLTAMGLEFSLAHDGREGVEIFGTDPEKFSLVLLDLTMPRMDGAEAFAELRRLRPGVPVVLMSGFNEQEALVRFAGKGLASFIQKPFTFDALRSVIRGVIG